MSADIFPRWLHVLRDAGYRLDAIRDTRLRHAIAGELRAVGIHLGPGTAEKVGTPGNRAEGRMTDRGHLRAVFSNSTLGREAGR